MSDNNGYTQIGIVIDSNGLDYRFPYTDLSFLHNTFNYDYSSPCNKNNSNYDSRCTGAYQTLKTNQHTVLVYNEENGTKVLLNSNEGAYVYYIPTDFFDKYFKNFSDYSFFLSDITGERLIKIMPTMSFQGSV